MHLHLITLLIVDGLVLFIHLFFRWNILNKTRKHHLIKSFLSLTLVLQLFKYSLEKKLSELVRIYSDINCWQRQVGERGIKEEDVGRRKRLINSNGEGVNVTLGLPLQAEKNTTIKIVYIRAMLCLTSRVSERKSVWYRQSDTNDKRREGGT